MPQKPRVLIFVVAYEAEKTITTVLRRIPAQLLERYRIECLVIDDCSGDRTFEASRAIGDLPFPLRVLYNPVNQGYGGNQKLGYHYAIKNGFDFVALLHGDGQYAPECLGDLLEPLAADRADAVFGSRMLSRGAALRGGMPLYKYFGNKILTWIENRMLHSRLSEFHSGYRLYSVAALQRIPFDLNSNGFHFDTEIIIQLVVSRARIAELPIPTYYGDEICRVNGLGYAWNVVLAVVRARLQELSLFYDRRFDCAPAAERSLYRPKLGYRSPHTLALERVPAGAAVLDLGCAGGYIGAELQKKGCLVTGCDAFPLASPGNVTEFILHDLNNGPPDIDMKAFDVILLLDVVEHMNSPERFVDELRLRLALAPHVKLLVSTGNVAFIVTRLMLLLGQFNYGKRGILDLTHARLFTLASIRRLFEQAGFCVTEVQAVPAPFPLALGECRVSRLLLRLNQIGIWFARGLFAYQVFLSVSVRPSLALLLARAHQESAQRAAMLPGSRE